MPFSIFQELQLGKLKSTSTSLHFADGSVKHPRGVVENVLIKVNKYYFPVDFIVLNMEENQEMPIILGWPFLATCRVTFDVNEGLPTLKVGKKKIHLSISRSTPCPRV